MKFSKLSLVFSVLFLWTLTPRAIQGQNQKKTPENGWNTIVSNLDNYSITANGLKFRIDYTQFLQHYAQNESGFAFQLSVTNISKKPIDITLDKTVVKVQGKPLTRLDLGSNSIWKNISSNSRLGEIAPGTDPAKIKLFKGETLKSGDSAIGWLIYDFSKIAFNESPDTVRDWSWELEVHTSEGKTTIDLSKYENEVAVEGPFPSKVDKSISIVRVGPRVNLFNVRKVTAAIEQGLKSSKGLVIAFRGPCIVPDDTAVSVLNDFWRDRILYQRPTRDNPNPGPNFTDKCPIAIVPPPNLSQDYLFNFNNRWWLPNFFKTNVNLEEIAELQLASNFTDKLKAALELAESKNPIKKSAGLRALAEFNDNSNAIGLLKTGFSDPDPSIRLGALFGALQPFRAKNRPEKLKDDSPFARMLVDGLSDPDKEVRLQAVRFSNQLGSDRVFQLLLGLLGDQDLRIRLETIRILGELGNPAALPDLRKLLDAPTEFEKETVLDSESKLIRRTPLDSGLAKLNHGVFPNYQETKALAEAKEKRALTPLLSLLEKNNYRFGQIAELLSQIGDPSAIEPIVQKFLSLPTNQRPIITPQYISQFGKDLSAAPLKKMLAAIEPSKEKKTEPETEIPNGGIRFCILKELVELKVEDAVSLAGEELIRNPFNARKQHCSQLIQALGKSGDPQATIILARVIKMPDIPLKTVIHALLDLDSEESYRLVGDFLDDPKSQYPNRILAGRTWTNSKYSVDLLKRLCDNRNTDISNYAKATLKKINAAPAKP